MFGGVQTIKLKVEKTYSTGKPYNLGKTETPFLIQSTFYHDMS